jgi:hypothetical protein
MVYFVFYHNVKQVQCFNNVVSLVYNANYSKMNINFVVDLHVLVCMNIISNLASSY